MTAEDTQKLEWDYFLVECEVKYWKWEPKGGNAQKIIESLHETIWSEQLSVAKYFFATISIQV